MRPLLLSLLLAAAPAAADPPGVSARFAIDGQRQLRGQLDGHAGLVTGGLTGGTLADPARIGDLAVYVGLRPELPRARVELRLTRPIDDAPPALLLDLGRPVGPKLSLAAQIGARGGDGDPVATLRLAASRRIAEAGALDLALTDASDGATGVGVAMRLPF
jgi:hypothetical protein